MMDVLGLRFCGVSMVPGMMQFTSMPDAFTSSAIRLVEIVVTQVPVVRPRRVNGRLRGAEAALNRETVATAIRAERDER